MADFSRFLKLPLPHKKKKQQLQDKPKYPTGQQAFNDPEDEEDELPGLSGHGALDPLLDMESDPAEAKQEGQNNGPLSDEEMKRTSLHKLLFEMWGNENIADHLFRQISAYADPESAKKTDNGFSLDLLNGHEIKWGIIQNGDDPPYEAITGKKRGFTEEDAATMVALARVHGWQDFEVHGKQDHKEKLWLAVMRQGLQEYDEFAALQAAGQIPADQKFPAPYVSNFRPDPDSEVWKKWQKELAEWQAKHQDQTFDADTPALTETGKGPSPEATAEKQAEQVVGTRQAMNGRIGEIITNIIGDNRLQDLFEGQQIPPEMAGKPSGEIALDMKVITPETKNALLAAQAAERTLQLVEKAENYAANPGAEPPEGRVGMDDKVFQFVGSERDPDLLKASQGTWAAAQMYLNQAIDTKGASLQGAGADFADGLRLRAAVYYMDASDLLKQEGHDEAAEKMLSVAQSIAGDIKDMRAPSPAELVQDLQKNKIEPEHAGKIQGLVDLGEKLVAPIVGPLQASMPPKEAAPEADAKTDKPEADGSATDKPAAETPETKAEEPPKEKRPFNADAHPRDNHGHFVSKDGMHRPPKGAIPNDATVVADAGTTATDATADKAPKQPQDHQAPTSKHKNKPAGGKPVHNGRTTTSAKTKAKGAVPEAGAVTEEFNDVAPRTTTPKAPANEQDATAKTGTPAKRNKGNNNPRR